MYVSLDLSILCLLCYFVGLAVLLMDWANVDDLSHLLTFWCLHVHALDMLKRLKLIHYMIASLIALATLRPLSFGTGLGTRKTWGSQSLLENTLDSILGNLIAFTFTTNSRYAISPVKSIVHSENISYSTVSDNLLSNTPTASNPECNSRMLIVPVFLLSLCLNRSINLLNAFGCSNNICEPSCLSLCDCQAHLSMQLLKDCSCCWIECCRHWRCRSRREAHRGTQRLIGCKGSSSGTKRGLWSYRPARLLALDQTLRGWLSHCIQAHR